MSNRLREYATALSLISHFAVHAFLIWLMIEQEDNQTTYVPVLTFNVMRYNRLLSRNLIGLFVIQNLCPL